MIVAQDRFGLAVTFVGAGLLKPRYQLRDGSRDVAGLGDVLE